MTFKTKKVTEIIVLIALITGWISAGIFGTFIDEFTGKTATLWYSCVIVVSIGTMLSYYYYIIEPAEKKRKASKVHGDVLNVELEYSNEHLTLSWGVKGVGFGEFVFKLTDREAMSDNFIFNVINHINHLIGEADKKDIQNENFNSSG